MATQITCPAQTVDLQVTAVDGTAPFVFEIVAPSSISADTTSAIRQILMGWHLIPTR
ncbi:hypothetical protein NYZ99_20080 [Maribacter litopenaei]|uniref:Uncharacterized protein n=1 Tax=Maribacter litopenaei TaxID=2976127 RepID=A0ABY5Y8F7_9FLAO|nr:hypothetical protein [Maribacter litopenaei]UWX54984.1 hypothetical protein NYZ99_20080 [Maribacter litopenaei]